MAFQNGEHCRAASIRHRASRRNPNATNNDAWLPAVQALPLARFLPDHQGTAHVLLAKPSPSLIPYASLSRAARSKLLANFSLPSYTRPLTGFFARTESKRPSRYSISKKA